MKTGIWAAEPREPGDDAGSRERLAVVPVAPLWTSIKDNLVFDVRFGGAPLIGSDYHFLGRNVRQFRTKPKSKQKEFEPE